MNTYALLVPDGSVRDIGPQARAVYHSVAYVRPLLRVLAAMLVAVAVCVLVPAALATRCLVAASAALRRRDSR